MRRVVLLHVAACAVLVVFTGMAAAVSVDFNDPSGGWTYAYTGDAAAAGGGSDFDALDGTWSHNNGSDNWDGSAIGAALPAQPGGASGGLADGDTTYARIQDVGDTRNDPDGYGWGRSKLAFGHDVSNEGAMNKNILDAGVTLSFRAKISTGGTLDNVWARYTGDVGPWPSGGHGYPIGSNGRGMFTITEMECDADIAQDRLTEGNNWQYATETVATHNGRIGFSLAMSTDESGYPAGGLYMNCLDSNIISEDVDPGETNEAGDPVTLNYVPISNAELANWHEFWITIEKDTSVGTHEVTVYMDGDTDPVGTFDVTAGWDSSMTDQDFYDATVGGYGTGANISHMLMWMGSSGDKGAYDIDFFAYKEGVHVPGGGAVIDGDLNGDGKVNSGDLDIVRGAWGQSVTPGCLPCGDPSGDGEVNSADLDVVRGNWGYGIGAAASVPEPGAILLGIVGLVFLAVRRRRG